LAFISYEYPPYTAIGGIGEYTRQVASLLANEKFDVHIFAGSHIQSNTCIENDITIHRVQCTGPHNFKTNVVPYFEMEHASNPFQLIESPEIHGNAAEIKQSFPTVPLIVRLHASNWLVESFKKQYVPLNTKIRYFLGALRRGKWDLGYWRNYDYKNDADFIFVQLADFISAPTIQMKNWVSSNWKINPDKIKVIENPFVENEAFKNAITDNEEQAIIFYGRLNVLKGLITATKAMKQILKNNPGWRWIVIGDDGTAADGKASMKVWMQSQLKNVTAQVTYYDSLPNKKIPELLRQASIVLIPSLFESYSYVTIEAMCAGKAVIGSTNTGIASLIENNVTGRLANPYNNKEWKNTVQQLINDKKLRQRIGKAAREYVESKYLINTEIIAYYKKEITIVPIQN